MSTKETDCRRNTINSVCVSYCPLFPVKKYNIAMSLSWLKTEDEGFSGWPKKADMQCLGMWFCKSVGPDLGMVFQFPAQCIKATSLTRIDLYWAIA